MMRSPIRLRCDAGSVDGCVRRVRERFVLALVAILTVATVSAGEMDPAEVWPRLVIVTFERRVPSELGDDAAQNFRAMRERTSEILSSGWDGLDGPILRRGDELFVFADGMSRDDHGANLKDIDWIDPDSALTFFSRMLRLPGGQAATIGGLGDTEHIRLRYDGDAGRLSERIRQDISAPITCGRPRVGDECDRLFLGETRAYSRPELTIWTQLRVALEELLLSEGDPPGRVIWVLARSGPRSYSELDTYSRIESDFVRRDAKDRIHAYADQGNTRYRLERQASSIEVGKRKGGGVVDVFQIVPREGALLASAVRPDSTSALRIELVGEEPLALWSERLRVEVSPISSDWSVPVPSLKPRVSFREGARGELLAGRGRISHTGGSLIWEGPLLRDGGHLAVAEADALDAVFQNLLRQGRGVSSSFDIVLDVIFVAKDGTGPGALEPPVAVRSSRTLLVEGREPEAFELSILAFAVLMSGFFLFRVWMTLRPARIHLQARVLDQAGMEPSGALRWRLPLDPHLTGQSLELLVSCDEWLRTCFARRFKVEMEWRCWPPHQLPLLDSDSPLVNVVAPDPSGKQTGITPTRVLPPESAAAAGNGRVELLLKGRLGRPARPRRIGPLIALELDPEVIDFAKLPSGGTFLAAGELTVTARPTSRLLPCREVTRPLGVRLELEVREVAPQPRAELRINESYRRLGLHVEPGPRAVIFGALTIRNPTSALGVARSVLATVELRLDAVAPDGIELSARVEGAPKDSTESSVLVRSGEVRRMLLCFRPSTSVRMTQASHSINGTAVVRWRAARGEEFGDLHYTFSFMWLAASAEHIGLDVGTSGVRIAQRDVERPGRLVMLPFHLGEINKGDESRPEEFPPVCAIRPGVRQVQRVGTGSHGVSQAADYAEIVRSPKGDLLSARGTAREIDARNLVEQYLEAVSVAASPSLPQNNCVVVATVPWAYGAETVRWFRRAVMAAIPRCVWVTILREAEAVAFYKLLMGAALLGPRATPKMEREELRTLVIDQGAGTTDYAVVAFKPGDDGVSIGSVRTIAQAQARVAGNAFDEAMLERVFKYDHSNDFGGPHVLWERLRVFKALTLGGLLSPRSPKEERLLAVTGVPSIRCSYENFVDCMREFYDEAFDKPLGKLHDLLIERTGDATLDRVVLAGRGILGLGCREHATLAVRKHFAAFGDSELPVETLSLREMEHAVAKGALRFALDGQTMLSPTDEEAVRNVMLVATHAPGMPASVELLLAAGTRIDGVRHIEKPFDWPVQHAWVVATDGPEDAAQQIATWLVAGDGEPPLATQVLAFCNPGGLSRRVSLELVSDEMARFSETKA